MSSVDTDVNALLNEVINTVSHEAVIDAKQSHGSPTSTIDAIDIAETTESSDSMIHNDDPLENEIEYRSRHQKKFIKKKTRSISESESELESQTKDIRRKFGSEGEILSICKQIIPLQKQKELNEAIKIYVDKLIKDTIFNAVGKVDINKLYEDSLSDNLRSKNIQGTEEFIVEQRLSSDRISKLVELGDTGSHKKNDFGFNGKVSESESIENEVDEASFGGYLADLDDTTSVDDLKSTGEDSFNNSLCSGMENSVFIFDNSEEIAVQSSCSIGEIIQNTNVQVKTNNTKTINEQSNVNNIDQLEENDNFQQESSSAQKETNLVSENNHKPQLDHQPEEEANKHALDNSFQTSINEKEQQNLLDKNICEQDQMQAATKIVCDSEKVLSGVEDTIKQDQGEDESIEKVIESANLILISPEEESLLLKYEPKTEENKITPLDVDEGLPQQKTPEDDRMKINWKVGNLHVKLPHKTRGKTHLKAWKKRRVVIQPDEFVNDPKNPSLVISVYGYDSKKHESTFWHSVSSLKAVVFRSSSRSHRHAFTISEGGQAIIHLSAENETTTQEWIAAVRAVLWPPSPFMELEKMLSGREFEVSIIDNEFSYHCGLLGMYGYLSITPTKLILIHPQQGYVIQEWYLNTVDKFQFVPQPKSQDAHKVLCMTTCSDSSTGQGEIIFFCNESITLLQSLASNIHQVLSHHSKQEGGKYQKELEEMAEWLVAPPQDCLNVDEGSNEHYKVPRRQVKSLLDIPNFIFKKSLSPVASAIYPAPNSDVMEPLDAVRSKQATTSHDSGISTCTSSDDFLNCSIASFVIGGGPMTGKSSDSELSDTYTPPRTPEVRKKIQYQVVKEEQLSSIDD